MGRRMVILAHQHLQTLCARSLLLAGKGSRRSTFSTSTISTTGFLRVLRNPYPPVFSVKTEKKPIAALPDDQPLVQPSTKVPTALILGEAPREKENRFILIDGKAVVYRAYYKLMAKLHHGNLNDTSGEGDWVLTVFTALSTVLKVFELTPSHIAVVFDHDGLTFRHTLFSNYKSNRSPTPDTVVQSLRYIKPALTAMGVKTVEVPGVEADDVIGTLAMSVTKAETKVRVLSPDKDFFQLLSPSLRLLRFVPRGSGIVSFGMEEFQARYGDLDPSQFVDILALTGDRIDNIPGVPGIGEKIAVKLIKLYGISDGGEIQEQMGCKQRCWAGERCKLSN